MIRLSGLEPENAGALIEMAERYAQSVEGDLPPETLPAELREKVSLRLAPLRVAA